MNHIQELDTSKLIRGLIRYIALVMVLLVLLIITSISLARNQQQSQLQNEYNMLMDKSIKHVVHHFLSDYSYRVKRIVGDPELIHALKEHDRTALYEFLYPKFKLMQEETTDVKAMHVHLANGKSLFRLHRPDVYGDEIAKKRPMLQEIHKNHKLISGYETGLHASLYRIIGPIFDEKKKYIGALEIALDPNFIVESIKEINGCDGLVFVNAKKLSTDSTMNKLIVDGYLLQSKLNADLKKMFDYLVSKESLMGHSLINFQGKKYLTHTIVLNDFHNDPSVKLIFFQKLLNTNPFLNSRQLLIYFGVFLVLVLVIMLIKKRIKEYQDEVTRLYVAKLKIIQKDAIQLEESQKYHKALFDTMPNILVATNGDTIEDANSEMLSFFSYASLEEFTKEHACICDFFLEEEGYLHLDMDGVTWFSYVKENPDLVHNVSMFNKDGEKRHFVVYIQELSYDENKRALISFVDVTELEKLNDRLEKALSGTTDGLWDWNLITNEMYLSPRWKSMLGYADEELTNEFENWSSRVHPDDLQMAMQNIEKSQEKPNVSYNGVYRLKHKDGHWVWIFSRGQTIFDETDRAVQMLGFHADISEIKELELKLLNSKNQFEMFMNNVPYIVLIKDENNNLIYENKVSKERQNNPEIIKLLEENLGGKLYKQVEKLADAARENGIAEDVLEYENGSEQFIYRALAFAIPQENNKVYVGAIYINITEHKLLAQEVQLQNQIMIAQSRHAAMGEMISMIAHQWRQPLGAISMDVNNVLVDIELDTLEIESLKADMNGIIEQTNHLSQTIDDFRNFFKPDKVKDVVSVEEVFMNAFKVIRNSLENNNIVVENHFEKIHKVNIFERELQQVLINLLKNAKEALEINTQKEKKIINKIFETKNSVIIEVCDNGGGILEENLGKVFDPYFSTKDEKNGTGLGLYMSKTIVEKHLSGKLTVRNMQEGACFTITLPKEDDTTS